MHIPEELNTKWSGGNNSKIKLNKYCYYLPHVKITKKILTGQVYSKKTDPGDGKPTCFYIWYRNSYMYYIECIKRFDIKNLPCTTPGYQCLCLSKISTFQKLHICRFDLVKIGPSEDW